MAVIGLLGSVAGFLRVRYLPDRADIDNQVFRLHYRFTSAVFFGACILISAFDLIGNPIDCISDDDFLRPDALNTYCWISFTFTLPGLAGRRTGSEVAHPFVGNEGSATLGSAGEDERRIHSYYQWVPFVLFLQGILFYLPHMIWKQYENGWIRNMTDGARGFTITCHSDERKYRSSVLSEYLQDTLHSHGRLALVHILCEVLNLVNVVGNIFFIDLFLGGAFLNFGTRVIQMSSQDQEVRTDPLIEIFPRMTKCTFHKYGPSGSVQKHDALCLLALNVLNEKLYIFVWFWLILLSVLTAMALVYRLVMIISPLARLYLFRRRSDTPLSASETVVRRIGFGDYFLLTLLAKNLEGFLFNNVIEDLALRFTGNHDDSKTSSLSKDSANFESAPILPR